MNSCNTHVFSRGMHKRIIMYTFPFSEEGDVTIAVVRRVAVCVLSFVVVVIASFGASTWFSTHEYHERSPFLFLVLVSATCLTFDFSCCCRWQDKRREEVVWLSTGVVFAVARGGAVVVAMVRKWLCTSTYAGLEFMAKLFTFLYTRWSDLRKRRVNWRRMQCVHGRYFGARNCRLF